MNGLPKNFDGSFLVGCALEMVCFNATQMYLHFSKGVTITVEGTFSYRKTASQAAPAIKVPVKESDLMQLLEQSVSKVTGDQSGALTLSFSNGQIFKCFDSSKHYESYQIKIGDKVIVI